MIENKNLQVTVQVLIYFFQLRDFPSDASTWDEDYFKDRARVDTKNKKWIQIYHPKTKTRLSFQAIDVETRTNHYLCVRIFSWSISVQKSHSPRQQQQFKKKIPESWSV